MQSVRLGRKLLLVALAVGCSSRDVSLGGDAPTPTPSPTSKPDPKPEPTPSPDPTPSPEPTPPTPGPIDPPKPEPTLPCLLQSGKCIAANAACAGPVMTATGFECSGDDRCCLAPLPPCEINRADCIAPTDHCSGRILTSAGHECDVGKVCCETTVGTGAPMGGASGMDPSLSGAGGE